MKTLFKFRLTQNKSQIRNIFRKPASAIITVIVVLLYGSILIPIFMHANLPTISGMAANLMVIGIIAFGLMMQLTTLLQNKRSLFFESDAHYLFTSPFTRRQVLGIYAYDNFRGALLFGLICLLPIMYGAAEGSIPFVFILTAFFAGTFAQYSLISLAGLLYLRELSTERKTARGNNVVLITMAVCIIAVGAYIFISYSTGGNLDVNAILAGKELNWIPFFGWARMAMLATLIGDFVSLGIAFALLLGAAAIITAITVCFKGDFYERSMADAEAFTEYFKKAREGKMESGKVHKAKVQFRKGVSAFLSKNYLIALKSRELFGIQDFIVIAIYIAMAYFTNLGFFSFSIMLMFWMLMKAGSASSAEDLQHHYIYLVPGSNMKKLFCTIIIPYIKNVIITLISLVIAGLLMGETAMGIVTTTVTCASVILVMTAGNILSLRLMKSRNNKMVEQVLRMVVALLALAPGVVVSILLEVFFGAVWGSLAWLVLTVFDLLVAGIVFVCCAPMMRGNELNSD